MSRPIHPSLSYSGLFAVLFSFFISQTASIRTYSGQPTPITPFYRAPYNRTSTNSTPPLAAWPLPQSFDDPDQQPQISLQFEPPELPYPTFMRYIRSKEGQFDRLEKSQFVNRIQWFFDGALKRILKAVDDWYVAQSKRKRKKKTSSFANVTGLVEKIMTKEHPDEEDDAEEDEIGDLMEEDAEEVSEMSEWVEREIDSLDEPLYADDFDTGDIPWNASSVPEDQRTFKWSKYNDEDGQNLISPDRVDVVSFANCTGDAGNSSACDPVQGVSIAADCPGCQIVPNTDSTVLHPTTSFASAPPVLPSQQVRVKILPAKEKFYQMMLRLKVSLNLASRYAGEVAFIATGLPEISLNANWWIRMFKAAAKRSCRPVDRMDRRVSETSFLQVYDAPSKISKILNLKVGIKPGSVYPRMATLIEDVFDKRDDTDANLRDALVEVSKLLYQAGADRIREYRDIPDKLQKIQPSFLELPYPLNPAVKDILRQRLLGRSDLEVDFHPPEESSEDIAQQLDSLAEGENTMNNWRSFSYRRGQRIAMNAALVDMKSALCA